jgi:beta-glucanase (GH16 family)
MQTKPLLLAIVSLLCSAAIAIAEPSTDAKAQAVADGYELVWADEFNTDGPPNADNWSYERGFVRNEELQWYQPENARCDGGQLIIEARREQVANPRYRADSRDWRTRREFAEYTSACLFTRRKHEWLYGRFETRGRIDIRAGLWPAWWMLGRARGWPGGGEIDIMEYYDGELLANVAWLGRRRGEAKWDESKRPIADLGDSDWSSKFHNWRMDWDVDTIKLYVDDKLLNETDLSTTINGNREAANPFHEPQYMLLNLAIGGTRGGDPSGTKFPARFEVDYVRVYQKPEEKPQEKAAKPPDASDPGD